MQGDSYLKVGRYRLTTEKQTKLKIEGSPSSRGSIIRVHSIGVGFVGLTSQFPDVNYFVVHSGN